MEIVMLLRSEINRIRETASSIPDKVVIEIDLISGELKWANDLFLKSVGQKLEDIKNTIFINLTPEESHKKIEEEISDKAVGKESRFSIWPVNDGSGSLVWLYVYQTRTIHPLQWMQADIIQITETSGLPYVFMKMQMEIANRFGAIEYDMVSLDDWMRKELKIVGEKHDHYDRLLEDLTVRIERSVNCAERAATAAIDAASRMEQTEIYVRSKLDSSLKSLQLENDENTQEILRLIGANNDTDKRLKEFESNVKSATDLAIKSIINQANRAGKGLSKKVTIPVSVIAAVATLVQILLKAYME